MGPRAKEMQLASKNCEEGKIKGFLFVLPEGKQPCQHPDFSSVRLIHLGELVECVCGVYLYVCKQIILEVTELFCTLIVFIIVSTCFLNFIYNYTLSTKFYSK